MTGNLYLEAIYFINCWNLYICPDVEESSERLERVWQRQGGAHEEARTRVCQWRATLLPGDNREETWGSSEANPPLASGCRDAPDLWVRSRSG